MLQTAGILASGGPARGSRREKKGSLEIAREVRRRIAEASAAGEKLTHQMLADEFHLSRPTITRYLTGEFYPEEESAPFRPLQSYQSPRLFRGRYNPCRQCEYHVRARTRTRKD